MKKRHADKNNILLVNITRLGDMLQATPTIAGMKMENPDCKITVLVEKQFESICHWLPNIDRVLSIDLSTIVRSLARGGEGTIEAYELVDEFIKELKSYNFDYCLNMSSSGYTALLLRMIGIERHGGWVSDEEGYRIISSDWAKLFATSVFHANRQFNSINLVDVFRSSAEIEQHPEQLQIIVADEPTNFVKDLLQSAAFTNTGPLISIQAGASQNKRQWAPAKFIELIKILINEQNARVVLTGTKSELRIIEPIFQGVASENVFVAAGKTNIPQLAALLKLSDLLVTGDTGPMHISAAVGTPTISMFLASAYGYETGPYGRDHIILQPVIGCGPCNPNKACANPECHDQISPRLVADLVDWRLGGMLSELPASDSQRVIIYRSIFDKFGFCDLEQLNGSNPDWKEGYRKAYRKLWLNELGGYELERARVSQATSLKIAKTIEGLEQVVESAKAGETAINKLIELVQNPNSPSSELKQVNESLGEIDRKIEELGFHHAHLGPVTRMFVFGKENISGTDAITLASQMKGHYQDLARRCEKLSIYYGD